MTPISLLLGRARRRCVRLLRIVQESHGCIFVRNEGYGVNFRDAERLHQAGLITAAASRPSWDWPRRRPFRELALFADEDEARRRYPHTVMPRRR